jgi:peptide/nickel transport system substrate-binding protein
MPFDRRSFMQAVLASFGGAAVTPGAMLLLDGALSRASAQQPATGRVPPIQFLAPNWPDYVEISRLIVKTWSQLGVTVEARQGTTQSVLAEVIGEHKMPHAVGVSWGGAPDRIDPDYFLTEFFHSRRAVKGGLNYGHFRSDAYDAIADAQRAEMDPEKRRALVWQAQAMLADENPILPLAFRHSTQAYNKARWEGVVPTLGSGIGQAYIPWTYFRMRPLTSRRIVRALNFSEIVTLNPFATPEIFNATLLRWLYPTFVTRGPDGELVPWAAESWTVQDPTTVDLVLRGGMTFDDGQPVTVQDVKFTFEYILQWKFPALARVTDVVEAVEIVSDTTVRFRLKQPSASFVPNVLGFCFVVPRHVWEKIPGETGVASPADWPNKSPVGYGGFRFVEWRKGEYLKVEARKDFFLPPQIDGVIWLFVPNIENQLAMMESGAADILGWSIDGEQAKRMNKHPNLAAVPVASHGLHEIRFNMELAPLNDPAFRLALKHATNRREIVDVVFGGLATEAANSVITPASLFWANPNIPNPEFSIERARQVLADAGYTWDSNGRLVYPRA